MLLAVQASFMECSYFENIFEKMELPIEQKLAGCSIDLRL